jgi:hypothetical protein
MKMLGRDPKDMHVTQRYSEPRSALPVTPSERNQNTRSDAFFLTVDRYKQLWLHTKLEGVEVSLELGEKDIAFQIMVAAMNEHNFDTQPAREEHHGQADNDDQKRS